MAPMKTMKTMKATTKMTKGGIAEALANEHDIKKGVASKILDTLATVGATEVKKNGNFVLPGLCMIKTRRKPATKACKREMFGEMKLVKAKPARTIVKAFCVSALKKQLA